MDEPKPVQVDVSLDTCAECNYSGGFHVIFERIPEQDDANCRVHLKCPSCRATYNIGWTTKLQP